MTQPLPPQQGLALPTLMVVLSVASLAALLAWRNLGVNDQLLNAEADLLLNLGGTKMLSRIARIGLFAELIGVVGLGLYLLIFQRKNDISVFFDG